MGLAYCVLCLKKIFKRYQGGKSDLPDLMLMCFLFGSLMLAYEFIANLGMYRIREEKKPSI